MSTKKMAFVCVIYICVFYILGVFISGFYFSHQNQLIANMINMLL